MKSASPLDEILAAVKARLEHRAEAARERACAVKQAADAYAAAVEAESLAELAGKVEVGIDVPSGASAREAASALRSLVTDLPELRGPSKHVLPEPPRSKESGGKRRSWKEELSARRTDADDERIASGPLLRQSAKKAKVVVVGGFQKHDQLGSLGSRLGLDVEWVSAEKASAKAVRSLEGRILEGRVAAVVLLDGFIAHTQSTPIVRAARQTGTPLAYGDKGGVGALGKALADIEAELARRARRD